MLLAKLRGAAFDSEIPQFEVAPHPVPAAIQDLSHATLAMVTEGGLVPIGNPDRLESSRGTKYFKYSIKERDDLKPGEFEAMHTGYDTSTVNADPDRLIPVDAMRTLEAPGISPDFTITIMSRPEPAPCLPRCRSSAPASPRSFLRRVSMESFSLQREGPARVAALRSQKKLSGEEFRWCSSPVSPMWQRKSGHAGS